MGKSPKSDKDDAASPYKTKEYAVRAAELQHVEKMDWRTRMSAAIVCIGSLLLLIIVKVLGINKPEIQEPQIHGVGILSALFTMSALSLAGISMKDLVRAYRS